FLFYFLSLFILLRPPLTTLFPYTTLFRSKNPLFIFVLSGLLPRFLTLFRIPDGMNIEGDPQYLTALSWFYKYVCAKIPGPPELGSLVYSICFLALMWALCYVLDKKKVYVKV